MSILSTGTMRFRGLRPYNDVMKKDSLVIDEKIYISSRRASEIAVYSKDYVGQLCREGKLVCKRINRLWWVEENSIRKHVAEAMKSNHTSFRSVDAVSVQPSGSVQSSGSVQPSRFIKSSRINPSTKSSDVVIAAGVAKNISHLANGGIVTEPTLAIIGESGLEAVVPLSGSGIRAAVESVVTDKNSRSRPVMYALFPRRIFAVGFVLALVLVFGTAVVSVSVWNGSKNSAPELSGSVSASVWDGLNGFLNNIASVLVQRSLSSLGIRQKGSSKITALNNSSSNANNGPTESAVDLSSPHAGLVVVPSQGSSTNAKLAQTITNSFSDNVTVTPAANGTEGLITPQFRTVNGHDFLYVLVPVKTASTTQ